MAVAGAELGVVLRLLCRIAPAPFFPVPFCDPGGMMMVFSGFPRGTDGCPRTAPTRNVD